MFYNFLIILGILYTTAAHAKESTLQTLFNNMNCFYWVYPLGAVPLPPSGKHCLLLSLHDKIKQKL